jgi:hypothetical protein
MSIDRIGWAGTRFDRKRCIHITGQDQLGQIELALTPASGIEVAWEALKECGVTPTEPSR